MLVPPEISDSLANSRCPLPCWKDNNLPKEEKYKRLKLFYFAH